MANKNETVFILRIGKKITFIVRISKFSYKNNQKLEKIENNISQNNRKIPSIFILRA